MESTQDSRKGNGGGSAMAGGAITQDRRGRFKTGRGLTEKQEAFCAAFLANGGNMTGAARAAGYAFPAVAGYQLMQNPAIAAEIQARTRAAVAGLSGLAERAMRSILEDETAPAPARAKVAIWVLESQGIGMAPQLGLARLKLDAQSKGLADFTVEELEAIVLQAEEAEEEAKRHDSAPAGLPGGEESPA